MLFGLHTETATVLFCFLHLQQWGHNSCMHPCCAGEDHRVTNGTVKIQPAQLYQKAYSSRFVEMEHLFLLGEGCRWGIKGIVQAKIKSRPFNNLLVVPVLYDFFFLYFSVDHKRMFVQRFGYTEKVKYMSSPIHLSLNQYFWASLPFYLDF